MIIGLNDIDPALAEVLKARMWTLWIGHQSRPEDAGARAAMGRYKKSIGWRILTAIPIGGLAGLTIAGLAGGEGGAVLLGTFLGAYFSAIGTGIGSLIHGRLSRDRNLTAEVLRAASTGLEISPSETVYLDTVCALLEAGGNVSDQTAQDILVTLNELLQQARHIHARLERLKKAASTDSSQELEEERDRLVERIAKAQDAEARANLTHSLAICDERLANAQALAPLIERMDAQREMVDQTMLSVQSSVTRLQVAPDALSAPDVEEVKRVVSEVAAQTSAVEDAVQEVMAVRS